MTRAFATTSDLPAWHIQSVLSNIRRYLVFGKMLSILGQPGPYVSRVWGKVGTAGVSWETPRPLASQITEAYGYINALYAPVGFHAQSLLQLGRVTVSNPSFLYLRPRLSSLHHGFQWHQTHRDDRLYKSQPRSWRNREPQVSRLRLRCTPGLSTFIAVCVPAMSNSLPSPVVSVLASSSVSAGRSSKQVL